LLAKVETLSLKLDHLEPLLRKSGTFATPLVSITPSSNSPRPYQLDD